MDRNNRRGVTLIELLVAMSVSGLILIAVLGIFGFSTRQFGTQTGRAETMLTANQAMNAMCKEIGQSVSFGYDKNGDMYFLPPATTDAQGNGLPGLIGGILGYSTSATAVKFYPSNDTGSTQGSNTSTGQIGLTALWRATTTKLNGNPKWQSDTAWSQLPNASAKPKYPDVTSLTFSTTGLPANTVRVTLTLADKEGSQTSSYTVSRSVYLSNHN
jgi:prepilin-type N-terminal cleavage/methylation domain-containing protein